MSERDDRPLFSARHDHEIEMSPYNGGRGTFSGSPQYIPRSTGESTEGWGLRSWRERWRLWRERVGRVLRRFRRATVAVAPEKIIGDEKDGVPSLSGPRGLCSDPHCTTCPRDFIRKKPLNLRPPNADGKLRKIFYEDTRGWARYFYSTLNNYFPVMNPQDDKIEKWNRFFIVACLAAIFIDPLFFLVLTVNQNDKCIVFDRSYAVGVAVCRSVTDGIYLLHMLIQFRLAYVAPETRVVGAGEFVEEPGKIARRYLRGYFALDAFNVLPLPQVLILKILPNSVNSGANNAKNLLRVTILIQYIPRIFRFLPLLAGQSATRFIYESPWVNFVINLLLFMLAGHVVGSCWYLFGLQRVNQCLRDACKSWTDLQKDVSLKTCKALIDCGYKKIPNQTVDRRKWSESSNATSCMLGNTDSFHYGIYESAVGVTNKGGFTRYIYSLFWGFQQISTLAGNLVPSYFVWEVMFTMGIIGLGLSLFALLVGSMQNFLLALGRRRLEMQLRRHDVEKWMSHRCLPEPLRNHIREAERFNWSATHGVNEDELIENLPDDLQRRIRRHLFMFLKKVRLFSLMDDQLLDSVCEKLRQNFYVEGSDILSQGAPVDKMVFIVRGKMEIKGADGTVTFLSEGGVCGEELLAWYLDNSSISRNDGGKVRFPGQYLQSNRAVRCTENVEAFTLHAADLEDISSLFARFLRLPRVQGAIRYESPFWRSMMATRIQVAWRYRKRRLSRLDLLNRQSMETNSYYRERR